MRKPKGNGNALRNKQFASCNGSKNAPQDRARPGQDQNNGASSQCVATLAGSKCFAASQGHAEVSPSGNTPPPPAPFPLHPDWQIPALSSCIKSLQAKRRGSPCNEMQVEFSSLCVPPSLSTSHTPSSLLLFGFLANAQATCRDAAVNHLLV